MPAAEVALGSGAFSSGANLRAGSSVHGQGCLPLLDPRKGPAPPSKFPPLTVASGRNLTLAIPVDTLGQLGNWPRARRSVPDNAAGSLETDPRQ